MKSKVYDQMGDEVAQLIKQGKIGIIPTDTIYGIVCDASNKKAVKRFYEFKKRINKVGTLVAGNIDDLVDLGIKKRYLKAVENLWPNPLSVVIPAVNLTYLHQGFGGLAIRIPKTKLFKDFLNKSGVLLTTSANKPDKKPAENAKEAIDFFGDTVDFYVDGGDLSKNQPSTIIKIIDDEIEILREGAITESELRKIRNQNTNN